MWNIDKALKLNNHPGSLLYILIYQQGACCLKIYNHWIGIPEELRKAKSQVQKQFSTERRDKYPKKDGSTM